MRVVSFGVTILGYSLLLLISMPMIQLHMDTPPATNDKSLASDHSRNLAVTSHWRKADWIHSMTQKPMMFHHHRIDLELLPISLNRWSFKDVHCLERFLGLELNLNLKWNLSIRSSAKDGGKIAISLYRFNNYQTHSTLITRARSDLK